MRYVRAKTHFRRLGPATVLALGLAFAASADLDDTPGLDFHPQTSAAAPCGTGTPPRGHFAVETSPATQEQGLVLTVRQDGNRLCYVSGGIAEAPVIRTRQGADMKITLRNEITDPAAISRYVAVARLDKPNPANPNTPGFAPVIPGMRHAATGATNIHVHGFAVPPVAPQDDVLDICVDPAVGPANCGRREFTYDYKIPASMPAGLYWYHPHVHGEVQAQMLMGLSGAIVVEGPDDDARRAAGIQDRVFVIRQSQDLDLKTTNQSSAGVADMAVQSGATGMSNIVPGAADRIDTAHELECSSSNSVDEITLNGAKVLDGKVSDANLAHYQIAAGSTQLWRFVNAATDAFLDLAILDDHGNSRPITVVARDGAPIANDAGERLRVPTTIAQLVPPGGRLEFLIDAPPVGHNDYLVSHAVDTGCAGDQVPERTLALITAVPTATASTSGTPAGMHSVPNLFSGMLARKTERVRTILLAEYPRPGPDDQTDFYIAERKPGMVLRPYQMGGPPAITVPAGSVEEWVVENWTNEIHAFHIHQLHFRLLAVNGKAEIAPPLLDVVNVPYATARGATDRADITAAKGEIVPGQVRIKLFFPPELAGDIPFHCHLVDHEDNGMMAILRILPARGGPSGKRTGLSPDELLSNPPICRPYPQTAMSAKVD